MKESPGCSPEIREYAVRLVIISEYERYSRWVAVQSIAARTGCGAEILRCWMDKEELGCIYLRYVFRAEHSPPSLNLPPAGGEGNRDLACSLTRDAGPAYWKTG